MIDSDFIDQWQPVAEMIDLSQIGTQMFDFISGQNFIGVQNKHPISAGVFQCKVASRGEIIAPFEVLNLSTMFLSNCHGAISRAGVDHDNLMGNVFYGLQCFAEKFLFILGNETNAQAQACSVLRQCGPINSRRLRG